VRKSYGVIIDVSTVRKVTMQSHLCTVQRESKSAIIRISTVRLILWCHHTRNSCETKLFLCHHKNSDSNANLMVPHSRY
jgi:hypothetical protein